MKKRIAVCRVLPSGPPFQKQRLASRCGAKRTLLEFRIEQPVSLAVAPRRTSIQR